MTPATPELIVLLGPTASGKTGVGVALARDLGGEIISADSRQVFRGMDLGTGKDLDAYAGVPHHLIDIAEPGTEFSLFAFLKGFAAAFAEIVARGRRPLLVGGTGLYLDAVLRGYRLVEAAENPALRAALAPLALPELRQRLLRLKPDQHNRTDLDNRERLVRAIEIAEAERAATGEPVELPAFTARTFGLRWPRDELRRRITRRLKERLAAGMVDEVARLHAAGVGWGALDDYGLEYRYIARHLQGEFNRNDMTQKLASAIHQFAKRQETWFRRMEKQGVPITWVDLPGEAEGQILRRLRAP